MDTAVKNMNKVASEQSDNYKRSMKKEYLVSTRLAFQNKIINFFLNHGHPKQREQMFKKEFLI